MTDTTVRRCLQCERQLVTETQWERMDRVERAVATHTGVACHKARGLCARCLEATRVHGRLTDYPTAQSHPRESVVAEWEWMHDVGELDPYDSRVRRIRYAAPRLGMSEAALSKALDRHARAQRTEQAAA